MVWIPNNVINVIKIEFIIINNGFFESTGRRGFSTLREVEIKSGKIINQVNLDKKYAQPIV